MVQPDVAPHWPGERDEPVEGVVVRAAAPADAAAVVSLEWRVRSARVPLESLAAAVVDAERLVVVATSGDELVGWAKTHHWDWNDGLAEAGHYLGGVTVDAPWRRRGVAAALTQARMEWIGERADAAWYVVNGGNDASIALHGAWGFEEVAKAARFHTVEFTGGIGILFRARSSRRMPP